MLQWDLVSYYDQACRHHDHKSMEQSYVLRLEEYIGKGGVTLMDRSEEDWERGKSTGTSTIFPVQLIVPCMFRMPFSVSTFLSSHATYLYWGCIVPKNCYQVEPVAYNTQDVFCLYKL